MSKNIKYSVGNDNCEIIFKDDIGYALLTELKKLESDNKLLIIYDSNLKKDYISNLINFLKRTGNFTIVKKFKGGKKNKNIKELLKIIDNLIENKFTKNSVIISIGGGVLGDLSALAASLYLRGLYYFHIPTTMTSIVDSCIGGKTAINYKNIINSFGNYYHAKRIFISHEIIKYIPEREYISGISEIIKCAIINKGLKLSFLKKNYKEFIGRKKKILNKLIYFSLKTKIKFFKNDVNEKKERLSLNFGHTFAHAIEMACIKNNNEIYRHGEAVGIGMLCELLLANKKNIYLETLKLLKLYNMPVSIRTRDLNNKKILQKKIYNNLFLDKKKIGPYPRYIKIRAIGNSVVDEINDLHLANDIIYQVIDFDQYNLDKKIFK